MSASNPQELAVSLGFVSQLCSDVLKGNSSKESSISLVGGAVILQHVSSIHDADADALLAACLSAMLSDHIMEVLQPRFTAAMAQDGSTQGMAWFADAVASVHGKLTAMHQLVEKVTLLCPERGRQIWKQAFQLVASVIVDQGSRQFRDRAVVFYGQTLRAFTALNPVASDELKMQGSDEEDEDEDDEEVTEEDVMDGGEAEQFMSTAHSLTVHLTELSWLSSTVGDVICELVSARIDMFVQRYKEKYYSSALEPCAKFCDLILLPWMKRIAPYESLKQSFDISEELSEARLHDKWREKLRQIVCGSLLRLRIKEMFDIVVYYPESAPVINEMKECCAAVDLKPLLVDSLRQALINRLLQPGAETRDIITQYAALVKALRQFDQTGVVMERVCHPVRLYLRCREDCGRCIIETLLTEESGELADEFERGVKVKGFEEEDYESLLANWDSWEPDPVDVCPDNTSASRTKTDVIGLLVTIYGSREQFLAQYQSLLAARLLRSLTYDNMQELGNLERVKVCFDDADMSRCDVMLADITSSRRVDKVIHERMMDSGDASDSADAGLHPMMASENFHSFMVSRAYWDARLPQDSQLAKLRPPPQVQRVMEEYGKQFSSLKNDRRLEWYHNLGFVELDLKFPSSTLSFTCDPLQASLISLFQGEHTSWSVNEITKALNVNEKTARSPLMYWVSEQVLMEDGTTATAGGAGDGQVGGKALSGGQQQQDAVYRIIGDTTEMQTADVADKLVLEGADEKADGDSAFDERVNVFWSYIEGMLTNFGELALDRIHGMISLYAEDEVTESELKKVLDVKLREREVVFSGGLYSLPD